MAWSGVRRGGASAAACADPVFWVFWFSFIGRSFRFSFPLAFTRGRTGRKDRLHFVHELQAVQPAGSNGKTHRYLRKMKSRGTRTSRAAAGGVPLNSRRDAHLVLSQDSGPSARRFYG